jgi:hypothetical protein
VLAEVTIDTRGMRGDVASGWDELKQHDVLFLLGGELFSGQLFGHNQQHRVWLSAPHQTLGVSAHRVLRETSVCRELVCVLFWAGRWRDSLCLWLCACLLFVLLHAVDPPNEDELYGAMLAAKVKRADELPLLVRTGGAGASGGRTAAAL